jgi:hypothetical protein
MPVGENERITKLEEIVGNTALTDYEISELTLPSISQNKKKNLLGYVEDNTKNVNTLNSYVGNWTTTMDGWGENGFKPTISNIIGNLDDLFDEDNNYKDN